jgi:hypothetical protein
MSGCPFHQNKLRPELPPLPANIAKLPVDERGYPVPWFVSWPNGKPEFRMIDGPKIKLAIIQKRCWVCGTRLRGPKTFVIGPMCTVNRNTAEPPCHLECAEFSVKACPFIMRPNMERREDDFTRKHARDIAGVAIRRNPGVTCLWTTLGSFPHSDGGKGILFRLGDPIAVTWWREGRTATRAEIMESIDSGLPLIEEHWTNDRERAELKRLYEHALKNVPAS